MNAGKKTAIAVGVMYIAATVASILGYVVMVSPILDAPDYLVSVAAREGQVLRGMLIQLVWALAVVGIPVMLFPMLKQQGETLALAFYTFRLAEGLITVVCMICQLALLNLSQAFVQAGAQDAASYHTSGTLLRAARDWSFMLGPGIAFSLSALTLNYVLYRARLVPRWLSGWGLVGGALSLIAYLLQFFGMPAIDFVFLAIGVQEMVFAVWLIVKGFHPPAIAAESVRQQA